MVSLDKNHLKQDLFEIVSYIFQSLLVAYLILLLIEQVWSGSVSAYFNLNYLLIAVIVFGIIDVFSDHKENVKETLGTREYVFIIILAVLGFVLIKYKTADLGWLSWVISLIASALIYLVSVLIYDDSEEEEFVWTLSWKKTLFVAVLGLLLLSVGLSFTALSLLESLRIVFGSVYVLFLPGFVLSYAFFNSSEIDWLERIALSFGLSIAIVPLVVFYLNLIGLRISLVNTSLTVLGVILISVGLLYAKSKNWFKRKKK